MNSRSRPNPDPPPHSWTARHLQTLKNNKSPAEHSLGVPSFIVNVSSWQIDVIYFYYQNKKDITHANDMLMGSSGYHGDIEPHTRASLLERVL